MTGRIHGHTTGGRPVDDELVDRLAEEAETGFDVETLIERRGRRGRPTLGKAPSTVESVRLDPELKERLVERARRDDVAVSEVIREALRAHLARN